MKSYVVAWTKADARKSPNIFSQLKEARKFRKIKALMYNIYMYDISSPKYVREYKKVE